jgi:hypothetical protein
MLVLHCVNPFAPKLENTPEMQFLVTEQATPEEVLQNFKLSYFFRDSVLYSDVIDQTFIFYYFDPNLDNSGQYVNWGRDTDLKTTGRLFRTFDSINLTWESTIYQDTLARDEDQTPLKIEMIQRFSLKLVSSSEELDYDLWGKAIFTFIKNPDDKKWRILQWKDESYY